jgi:hypothetical protein
MAMQKTAMVKIRVFRHDSVSRSWQRAPTPGDPRPTSSRSREREPDRDRLPLESQLTLARGSRPAEASRGYRQKAPLTIRSEGKTRTQIIVSQVREVGKDLSF